MRLVMVFTHASTFPNRKVKSGVGKIAEEELENRRGSIDWFIYWKHILNPLFYPFTTHLATEFFQRNIKIMEDNTPVHIHHYHDISHESLCFYKASLANKLTGFTSD